MRSRSESPPPGSIFAKKARQDEGKDNGKGNTDNGNTNKERAKMRPRFMLSAKQHEQLSNMNKVVGNGKGNKSKVKGKRENFWPAMTQIDYDKEDAALVASEATSSASIDLTSPPLRPKPTRPCPTFDDFPETQFYDVHPWLPLCSRPTRPCAKPQARSP